MVLKVTTPKFIFKLKLTVIAGSLCRHQRESPFLTFYSSYKLPAFLGSVLLPSFTLDFLLLWSHDIILLGFLFIKAVEIISDLPYESRLISSQNSQFNQIVIVAFAIIGEDHTSWRW